MVKVKKSQPIEKVEDVKEVKEEVKEKEIEKKEEKPQVLPSKEKISEFYGITDSEILNPETDYSKYNITPEEEGILRTWWVEHMKHNVKDVTFDLYDQDEDVRAILNKYWVLPMHVAENKLDELEMSESEKEIITNYYYRRAGIQNI